MPLRVSNIELRWADDDLVRKRLIENGFDHDDALKSTNYSDRTTHVYEGGFKLGCGAGLPGILCALRGASHVTLHDFNDCVVQCFTKENLRLNGVEESKYSLASGPWTDFQSTVKPRRYVSEALVCD
ncbi:hypothetical protein COOONC_10236 [Cooperia oncophora]